MKSLTHIGIALILSGLLFPSISHATDPRVKKIAPLVTFLYLHTEPSAEVENVVQQLVELEFTNERVELTLEELLNWHANRPLPLGKRRYLEMEAFVERLGKLSERSSSLIQSLLTFTLFNPSIEVSQLIAYQFDAIFTERPWEAAELLRGNGYMMLREKLASDTRIFSWRSTFWQGTRKNRCRPVV